MHPSPSLPPVQPETWLDALRAVTAGRRAPHVFWSPLWVEEAGTGLILPRLVLAGPDADAEAPRIAVYGRDDAAACSLLAWALEVRREPERLRGLHIVLYPRASLIPAPEWLATGGRIQPRAAGRDPFTLSWLAPEDPVTATLAREVRSFAFWGFLSVGTAGANTANTANAAAGNANAGGLTTHELVEAAGWDVDEPWLRGVRLRDGRGLFVVEQSSPSPVGPQSLEEDLGQRPFTLDVPAAQAAPSQIVEALLHGYRAYLAGGLHL